MDGQKGIVRRSDGLMDLWTAANTTNTGAINWEYLSFTSEWLVRDFTANLG